MSRAGLGSRPHGVLRVGLLAALAMTAFAANSVLARLALDGGGIDPGTFTVIRLSAGASVLVLSSARRLGRIVGVVRVRGPGRRRPCS